MTGKDQSTLVSIVGGGLSGSLLALALARQGIATTLIERTARADLLRADFDGRTTAIALASRNWLGELGLWEDLAPEAEAIQEIRTADEDSPSFLHFDVDEVEATAFGWIVENRFWRRTILEALEAEPMADLRFGVAVESFTATTGGALLELSDATSVRTGLVAAADGKNSNLRQSAGIKARRHRYDASALAFVAAHEEPHEGVALEHFRTSGPFAVLPMTDGDDRCYRSAVVWTEHDAEARRLAALDRPTFDAVLQTMFGDRLGRVKAVTQPALYPLELVLAEQLTAPRLALVGEAGHAIHPIAGQGLNLSMRDAAWLADALGDQLALGLDPGTPDLLRRYAAARRPDILAMAAFTHGIDALFSNASPPLRALRALGLGLVERAGPVKRGFMRHAMGTTRLARAPGQG